MNYVTRGYYTVFSSALLSLLAYVFALRFLVETGTDWLTRIAVLTVLHISVIGLQAGGILLFLFGYKKNEALSFNPIFNILLIVWGSLVSWWAISLYYYELLPWSMEPLTRSLTIWDGLEYGTWAFKGLLWIASGLIFIVTAYVPEKSELRMEK